MFRLAAYFHNGRDKRGFICGGSLISTRLVITAAHCVHNKGSSRPNKAEEATFYLGKYHINKISETHDWMLGVERFEIHEDWDSNDLSYDADIAIAILRQTITFTAYIKAICLWTSTTSYEDLVSKTGIVAGWGRTEDSADASDRPKFSKVPVVSSDRCLRSDSAFGKLTSDRTFCGGSRLVSRSSRKKKLIELIFRTNEGPCNGDSGGGLIIKDQDKWYLRGVVSASLVGEHGCDVKNYAIFTDVQWYVRWIQGYITDYN